MMFIKGKGWRVVKEEVGKINQKADRRIIT
jgi:hypothetical protein